MNINSFDSALDFTPTAAATRRPLWTTVASTFEALREGIQLANEYKTLTSRGVSPDIAVRAVFDHMKR